MDDVAAVAIRAMEAHREQMTKLAEKYIGKNVLAQRDASPNLWSKQMWHIGRIKHLMWQKGMIDQRLRRCKADSLSWKRYETMSRELELLADNVALDLVMLNKETK